MLSVDEITVSSREKVSEADIILPPAKLPLCATYYPLGFPLRVFSNSRAVMDAAEASWKSFRQKFTHAPLELHIAVQDDDSDSILPPAPVCRLQWDILLC